MEIARTSQAKISRLTVKGQMTLPKEYQDKLGVGPGDYVVLLEVDEGILIKKANRKPKASVNEVNIFTEMPAEKTLRETVLAFGKAAKKRGLSEEGLEQEIKDDLEKIRSEMYKEQYCVIVAQVSNLCTQVRNLRHLVILIWNNDHPSNK